VCIDKIQPPDKRYKQDDKHMFTMASVIGAGVLMKPTFNGPTFAVTESHTFRTVLFR